MTSEIWSRETRTVYDNAAMQDTEAIEIARNAAAAAAPVAPTVIDLTSSGPSSPCAQPDNADAESNLRQALEALEAARSNASALAAEVQRELAASDAAAQKARQDAEALARELAVSDAAAQKAREEAAEAQKGRRQAERLADALAKELAEARAIRVENNLFPPHWKELDWKELMYREENGSLALMLSQSNEYIESLKKQVNTLKRRLDDDVLPMLMLIEEDPDDPRFTTHCHQLL